MIFIASDHRGFELKEKIKEWLVEGNYQFEDLGNDHFDPEDDYPDFAKKVAERLSGPTSPSELEGYVRGMGIVICGSGVGVDIVTNRYSGVRCGLGFSINQVKKAREDDDINCLALAADFLDEEVAKELVNIFLITRFSGEEKKKRRIEKIDR